MHHPENYLSFDHNITSTSGEFTQGYSYVHHPSMMSIPNRGVVQVPGWQQFSHSYPVPMPIPIPVHQHHSEDHSVVWNDLMVWDHPHSQQYHGVPSSSLSSLDSVADNQTSLSNEPVPDSIIKLEQYSPRMNGTKSCTSSSVFAPPVVEADGQIKLPINRLRNTKPSHSNPRSRRVPKISTDSPVNTETNTTLTSSPTSTTPTPSHPPLRQKKAHSIIEKKYRTTINQALTQLRLAVPELNPKVAPTKGAPPVKLNKANILRKATQHISNLEQERDTLKGQLSKFMQFIEMTEGGREFLQQAQVEQNIGSNA